MSHEEEAWLRREKLDANELRRIVRRTAARAKVRHEFTAHTLQSATTYYARFTVPVSESRRVIDTLGHEWNPIQPEEPQIDGNDHYVLAVDCVDSYDGMPPLLRICTNDDDNKEAWTVAQALMLFMGELLGGVNWEYEPPSMTDDLPPFSANIVKRPDGEGRN